MLSSERMKQYRQDAVVGNSWRYDSAVAEDYYDGNQYDADTAQKMEERGMPLTVANMCRDLVQTLVGMQERALTDYIVRPEADDDYRELAQVLSLKLKEVERRTEADRVWLDASASQNKAGIGWLEVGRGHTLLDYPYRVNAVDWRELWWDPRSKASDIVTDSEYVRRVKWFERDEIKRRYPKQIHEIEMLGRGSDYALGWYEPQSFARDMATRDMTQQERSLWGANRDLVALEEIYYRSEESGYAVRLPAGQWVRFDPTNAMHMQAYESGIIEPRPTLVKRMNRAVFCGDAKLSDGLSPLPHDEFPYIPVLYDREARTGAPYGLIRVIQTLQDQVNTRLSRAMWGLNQKQIWYDSDVFEDPDIAREEANRPDGMIELNAHRNPNSKYEVNNNFQMSREQMSMHENMLFIMPQLAGVPRSLSGQKEPGVNSGVAINALVEQGVNSQARPFAAAANARKRMGQQLLAMIIEDLGDQPAQIMAEKDNGERLQVPVNQPTRDEQGYMYVKNAVQQVQMHVTLDEVPSTSTFRQAQFQEMARAIQNIGDERLRTVALPALIEMSEMPRKHELANMIRKQTGQSPELTPEEQQGMQRDQQMQQMMQEVELALKQAEAASKQARAARDEAAARHEIVKMGGTAADTQHTEAETGKTVAETSQTRAQTQQTRAQTLETLRSPPEQQHRPQQQTND